MELWKYRKRKRRGCGQNNVYVCGGQNTRGKKKKMGKGNVWRERKKKQRIRNHNLKILPQYFHYIFTINFK